MFRVAWKSVLGNKLRLALTGVAIIIGVAFVAGTFVLTDSIDRAFTSLLTDINVGVDGYVNPTTDIAVQPQGPPTLESLPTFDAAVLDDVAAADGVATAAGIAAGYAQIIGGDGEPIGQTGPPKQGFSWSDAGPLVVREGREPTAPGEVVIDVASAASGKLAVGDAVTIISTDGVQQFELVGTVGFGSEDNFLGATVSAFELSQAQELFGMQGRFTQIAFSAVGDADPEMVVANVASALDGNSAVDVASAATQQAEDQQEITQGLSFINVALLAFAGIALFVGAFLIVNTFNITVAQRTREFALLRAVGASGAQVRVTVLIEALVIGLLASTVGLLGGIVFGQLLQVVFDAIGIGLPDGGLVVKPRTIIASYVIGVGITAVAAIGPARRASKVAPVEALRGSGDQDPETIARSRSVGGLLVTVVGLVPLAIGLFGSSSQAGALVGFGAAALFIGVSLLAPLLTRPVAGLLGLVSQRRGIAGVLARNNAQRNPKRTASTASALMIGVALVTFVSIFSSSAVASVDQLFAEQLGADFLISSTSFGPIPRAAADDLRGVEGLTDVASQRGFGPIEFEDGSADTLTGMDFPEMIRNADLQVTEGDLATIGAGEVFIKADRAARDNLAVGDTVTFKTPKVDSVTLTIAGIFEDAGDFSTPYLVDADQWDEVQNGADVAIFARLAESADAATVKAAVEISLETYPGLQVQDQADLRQQVRSSINTLLNVLIGLLFLAVFIALIGIVNTLALSIFERTREIGLLRAVGMTRTQVRTMVRWEAIMVAVFGALLGVTLGAFLGWAMVTAIPDLPVLEFPVLRMVIYVIFAAAAGVVAAILPARRAANLDVLRAVATE